MGELADAIDYQQRASGPSYLENNGLEELYLDSNVMGDEGAFHIAKLLNFDGAPLLKILSLQSNRITDAGAEKLLESVNNNGNILALKQVSRCPVDKIYCPVPHDSCAS